MLETTREKILNNVKNELTFIKTENGYDNDLAEIKIGLFGNASITNYPTAFLMFGDDNLVRQTEGNILGESQIDLAVIVYQNTNCESLADETEKVIKDLYKFFSRDISISREFTSSLSELEYVLNYSIQVTSSYISGINNSTACGIVLRIEYLNQIDSVALPEPEIPQLNSPSNGFTGGTVNQAFNWNDAENAISYKIEISNDSSFEDLVLEQGYLLNSSYTVPDDINLVNGNTYYWKVRSIGVNESSDWSNVYSITVNDVSVIAKTPVEIGSCILWARSDVATTVIGNKVSVWADQSGSGNDLVQGTDTNRPVLTANVYNGKAALYHDPTGNVRKTLGYNDTAKKFEITGSSSKSVMITIKPDLNYAQGNVALGLIGRTNANYGDNWIIGKYNDNLINYRGVIIFPKYNDNLSVSAQLLDDLMQVVITVDGTNMTSYRNGVLMQTYPRAVTTNFASETTTWLTVGSEYHTANTAINYKGYTFETAFWNKALSQIEVSELYEYHKNYYGL